MEPGYYWGPLLLRNHLPFTSCITVSVNLLKAVHYLDFSTLLNEDLVNNFGIKMQDVFFHQGKVISNALHRTLNHARQLERIK